MDKDLFWGLKMRLQFADKDFMKHCSSVYSLLVEKQICDCIKSFSMCVCRQQLALEEAGLV